MVKGSREALRYCLSNLCLTPARFAYFAEDFPLQWHYPTKEKRREFSWKLEFLSENLFISGFNVESENFPELNSNNDNNSELTDQSIKLEEPSYLEKIKLQKYYS